MRRVLIFMKRPQDSTELNSNVFSELLASRRIKIVYNTSRWFQKRRPAGSRPSPLREQTLEGNIDLYVRPVIMLEFRTPQDRKLIASLRRMSGIHEVHITQTEPHVLPSVIVIIEVPDLSVEGIESNGTFS